MSKRQRQQALLALISEYEIDTQEELTRRLQALGFATTQATVSRDIRELGLEKISYNGNMHKYAVSEEREAGKYTSYRQIMSSSVISVDCAQNIIVVRTVAGMAMAVGAAVDNMQIEGIMGCIAGDDTLFLAIRDPAQAEKIIGEIKKCC